MKAYKSGVVGSPVVPLEPASHWPALAAANRWAARDRVRADPTAGRKGMLHSAAQPSVASHWPVLVGPTVGKREIVRQLDRVVVADSAAVGSTAERRETDQRAERPAAAGSTAGRREMAHSVDTEPAAPTAERRETDQRAERPVAAGSTAEREMVHSVDKPVLAAPVPAAPTVRALHIGHTSPLAGLRKEYNYLCYSVRLPTAPHALVEHRVGLLALRR